MAFRLIDIVCPTCGWRQIDKLLPHGVAYPSCPECQTTTERLWSYGSSASVVGDECDVTIKHGLCHADGTPRRFTSKAEIAREATKRGLTNHVTHQPMRGSDKSPHTTRWV